jgi:hypothetical protein
MKLNTLPASWQEAASMVLLDAMTDVNRWSVDNQIDTGECQKNILHIFEQLVDDVFHSEVPGTDVVRRNMFHSIAAYGIIGYANETKVSAEEAGMHVLTTVIGKQRMYGHGNIARFGVPGLIIRLNDKLERLKNLQKHDGPVLFEPLADTWLDICGYSLIAIMWVSDWFMLELESGQQ